MHDSAEGHLVERQNGIGMVVAVCMAILFSKPHDPLLTSKGFAFPETLFPEIMSVPTAGGVVFSASGEAVQNKTACCCWKKSDTTANGVCLQEMDANGVFLQEMEVGTTVNGVCLRQRWMRPKRRPAR